MHDCALGREEGTSALRVEHRYYFIRYSKKSKKTVKEKKPKSWKNGNGSQKIGIYDQYFKRYSTEKKPKDEKWATGHKKSTNSIVIL